MSVPNRWSDGSWIRNPGGSPAPSSEPPRPPKSGGCSSNYPAFSDRTSDRSAELVASINETRADLSLAQQQIALMDADIAILRKSLNMPDCKPERDDKLAARSIPQTYSRTDEMVDEIVDLRTWLREARKEMRRLEAEIAELTEKQKKQSEPQPKPSEDPWLDGLKERFGGLEI